MKRSLAGVAWIALAVTLLVAYRVGAEWGAQYAVGYGSFAITRGEAILRLNLLLLVLPAGLALAWGAALLAGPRLSERFDALGDSTRAWDAALAVWLLAATWAVRAYVLQGAEVTDDENAYHLQARLLETGRFFVPSLPEPFRAFLDNQFVVNDGRRYAVYFVGHPAWLAIFRWLGLEDLAGPVATAGTGLLAMAVARRAFGASAAALTAGLLATSPFLLLLGATHLSQPTTGLLTTAFLYALVRLEGEPARARWWALGAAAISATVLVRPQSAVAFLLVGVGAVAWSTWRGQIRPGRRPVLVGLGVGLLGIAVLLWVNAARSGSPWRTSYQAYMAQGAPWIFPSGFRFSVRQAAESLGHLQFWLFGWPPSLLFLPFFERTRVALLAAAMVGATTLLYAASAIPTVAPVGPVYFGESIPILAMLSASGIGRLVALARQRLPGLTPAAAVAVVAPCLAMLGMVTFLPPQLSGLSASADLVRLPYTLVQDASPGRVVVFVSELPARSLPPGSWAYYHRNADPDLRDPIIYVKDLGRDANLAFLSWLGDRRGFTLAPRERHFVIEPLERK